MISICIVSPSLAPFLVHYWPTT